MNDHIRTSSPYVYLRVSAVNQAFSVFPQPSIVISRNKVTRNLDLGIKQRKDFSTLRSTVLRRTGRHKFLEMTVVVFLPRFRNLSLPCRREVLKYRGASSVVDR